MIKVLLALIAASMFAGAALYISLAEHPARMRLDDRAALAQWGPSYSRAAPIQAALALASLLLGLWAWWRISGDWLLAGALLIGAAIPLTLAMIMPINSRLKATAPDAAGADSRALLTRWGKLHALRTILGLASVGAYFTAFMLP